MIEKQDTNGLYLVKDKDTPQIDEYGNITNIKQPSRTYHLSRCSQQSTKITQTEDYISNSYFYIEHIKDDHYIVGNPVYKTPNTFEIKYGIIKLKRSPNGIICKQETIIAPIVYDKLHISDPNYIIVEYHNHYSYFSIDTRSQNYGKQLIPLILTEASPFNIKYEGFAECTINGVTRFIPIDLIPTEVITPDLLLTEEEVIALINSIKKFETITPHKKMLTRINGTYKKYNT